MAKRKTTELTTITAAALAAGDWFPVVDVSDTTDSSTGTNKKIAKSELAEAAGVTAHLADTSDAHDASAISYNGSSNLSATEVEAALDELDAEKAAVTEPIAAAHIADGTDAHDASAISVLDTAGNWTATDVEGVLAEVPSRYALRGYRHNNRTIAIGDSTIAGSDDQAGYSVGDSWFSRLCAVSGQTMRFHRNAGVAGETSTQYAARFAADVVAHSPGFVVIGAPTNDRGAGISLATSKTNTATMVAAARAAGIVPLVTTQVPSDGVSAQVQATDEYNAWVRAWGNANGVYVLDVHTALVDSADRTFLSTLTADGVHPNSAGQEAIATYLASRLPRELVYSEVLSSAKGDYLNLVTNGVFVTDTNADGYADNWAYGGGTVVSKSLTSRAPYGNWQNIESNGSIAVVVSTLSASGWSPGDRIALAFDYKTSTAQTVSVTLKTTVTDTVISRWKSTLVNTSGSTRVGYVEAPIPVGAAGVYAEIAVNSVAGTCSVGRMTVTNLTALGD